MEGQLPEIMELEVDPEGQRSGFQVWYIVLVNWMAFSDCVPIQRLSRYNWILLGGMAVVLVLLVVTFAILVVVLLRSK